MSTMRIPESITGSAGAPSGAHRRIVEQICSRWPENRPGPSLERISALCELLGSPQHAAPVIQITGTNGKGSTAIIIDSLLRAMGLRTGRFTSPHLQDISERICIDGRPISSARFDDIWHQIEPMVAMVDEQQLGGIAMTFFEVMTGMAFAAFADAPVDVMVMEVGMGGRWDATNVADASVAVVGPVGLDHMEYLGDTIAQIAAEKAGIIKAGSIAVLADQEPQAAMVLQERCLEVGVPMVREGVDFGLLDRQLAVGGQLVQIQTASGPIADLHLPLYGAHMAHNAAVSVAAVEAFLGGKGLEPKLIETGFAQVKAPARLETVHREPTVVLDTCHNPQGAQATMAALSEAFDINPLVGVVAMMSDKQVDAVLGIFEESMDSIVVTKVSDSPRAMPVDELAEIAEDIFGSARVHRAQDVATALDAAMNLAQAGGERGGVLVAGSVWLAGQARELLGVTGDQRSADPLQFSVADAPEPPADAGPGRN
ncbi:dihydrofolate synthase / folylpolyglutamate synthase [Propionibacterium cyclohexanicum]|uniref:Dihydrofolate synthase/folylpolyglutamate synthase n=1 Tax=Propionibacterium cyclohexanicum TaxID=64702 RepID=A0A1H9SAZ6_9ACTN|nr:folylpolyglutamate synthase/dihydrofolate synthase family protein [Propionibacterium cyclohexanicum]SER82182.1 dihydrofolate synthase / folylpolyglutamate synthase [Propionibacterium cyclohexanicum]